MLLQELKAIRVGQNEMMETFITKVKKGIEESSVGGNAMTEQRLGIMFDRFANELREQLNHLALGRAVAEPPIVVDEARIETGDGYSWHYFRGTYHRVPED